MHSAEAERCGHTVYNLTDFPRSEHNTLNYVEYVNNNFKDYEDAIKRIFQEKDIDYISTQCEVLYPLIDKLSREGYPTIPIMGGDVDELVNKERFANFCRRIGLPQPDTFAPTKFEEIADYDRPIFIKPTNGTDGTIKLHLSDDKYAFFDYCRFPSVQTFMDTLEKADYVEEFLRTQNEMKDMPSGKGIHGIRGRHLIQECVVTPDYFYFNFIVDSGKIKFLMSNKSRMKGNANIYMYLLNNVELLVLPKDENNHAKMREFVGEHVFESFMEQITKLIEHAKVELCGFNMAFIPWRDTYHIQDVTLRHGGNASLRSMNTLLNQNTDYDSIWEYV